jgi:ethanolamine ammonia-lyase small subunit
MKTLVVDARATKNVFYENDYEWNIDQEWLIIKSKNNDKTCYIPKEAINRLIVLEQQTSKRGK